MPSGRQGSSAPRGWKGWPEPQIPEEVIVTLRAGGIFLWLKKDVTVVPSLRRIANAEDRTSKRAAQV
jgi:hypothetical protein